MGNPVWPANKSRATSAAAAAQRSGEEGGAEGAGGGLGGGTAAEGREEEAYRLRVVSRLPGLMMLDCADVTEQERTRAKEVGCVLHDVGCWMFRVACCMLHVACCVLHVVACCMFDAWMFGCCFGEHPPAPGAFGCWMLAGCLDVALANSPDHARAHGARAHVTPVRLARSVDGRFSCIFPLHPSLLLVDLRAHAGVFILS